MDHAIALVHAYLLEHPEEYCTWVRPHVQLRARVGVVRLSRIGGHYRRKSRVVEALRCTCKFEPLVNPPALHNPPHAVRIRRDEDGTLLPRTLRVWVWI